MTFESSHSVSLKIWDRSAIDHTLDAAAQDLSVRANTTKCRIAVHASGPNTFTLTVRSDDRQLVTV